MKRGLVLIPGVILMVFGLWYLTLGKSIAESRQALEEQIRIEERRLDTYQQAVNRLQEQADRLRPQEKVSDTRPAVPTSGEDEVITLYRALDSLCRVSGDELHEITPSLNETITFLRHWSSADTALSIPIRIRIDADYRSLSELMGTIESRRYFGGIYSCRIYGSAQLYPNCALDLSFVARLGNRVGMVGRE